jgi:hypothetical protein
LCRLDVGIAPEKQYFRHDGGFLMHKVRRVKGSTFRDILASYTTFVARHFGSTACIVFDGYGSGPTTKDHATKKASVAPDIK